MQIMTATMPMPNATKRRQDIVAMNVSRILTARGLRKKDLAKAMGVSPQAMASRLQSKANWTIDEACSAADFLHVSLDLLLKENLTAAEVLGYENTAAPDSGSGGVKVSDFDLVPQTGGPWTGRSRSRVQAPVASKTKPARRRALSLTLAA